MEKHIRCIELSKPKEQNSYYQADPQKFDELLELVQRHPNGYSLKLNANGRRREPSIVPQYKSLNEWIDEVTAFKLSDPFYKTSTKCFWILNDMHDFPACGGCGKNENFMHVNVHLKDGYPRNCSMKCRQSDPLTIQRRKNTCRERYGADNPYQNEAIKQKCCEKKLEKYGNAHFTNPEKAKQTFKLRCKQNPQFLKSIEEKKRKTSMRNFGCENAAQCPEIVSKMHKKYVFDSMTFDSSIEIAYFIWMRSNGEDIQKASRAFTYVFNGKAHFYIPDFYLPQHDQYVEVKGSHFFKSSDGTMMIPWRKKNWTDEEYKTRCQKEEAKHQCMLANNVKIVLDNSEEMKMAVQHMKARYGRNYAQMFKYTKKDFNERK